ncbi:hypothetical protein CMO84_10680 [Candidatus Woesearchaeota archaeon]|nr:hypothetical protein [Candidatus Woesearchaeota archaeon]
MHSRHTLHPPPHSPTSLSHRLTRTPEITLREYQPADGEAILAAFNRIFAEVQEGFSPRSLAEWRWRFVDNPAGGRASLALDEQGRVLAQYAGLGVRLLLEGEEVLISQSVDSFCDPAVRGGLARAGLFVQAGRPYAERHGFDGEGEDRLMYGLPVPAAWRVGRDQLQYSMLSPLWRLEGSAVTFEGLETESDLCVEAGDKVPDGVDALFDTAAAGQSARMIKDRRHLAWRYDARPEGDYLWLHARRKQELVGWMVLAPGTVEGRQALWIMDSLVGHGDDGARRALMAAAGQQARGRGLDTLASIATDACRDWDALQQLGLRVVHSGYSFAGRSYMPRRPVAWWADHLSLDLGDTDLL